MDLGKIPKEELIALISEYNSYIQEANEQDKYANGWKPVCLSEFYDNEFQLWKEETIKSKDDSDEAKGSG